MPENSLSSLPDGLLIAWLGDDFTGASAVMEVLSFSGLPSVLFLQTPTAEDLSRFPDVRGVGVASITRTLSTTEITDTVPGALRHLNKLGAQLLHYKVCTTLDSSPAIGSIGCALESGARELGVKEVPVLIAAPQMRRYQSFGHLFASFNDTIYRIDRHPVMQRHPVTPVNESDVAAHLKQQTTSTEFGCVSLEDLQSPAANLADYFEPFTSPFAALTIDCVDQQSEETVGALLWQSRKQHPFIIGSQGVEYALIRHWQAQGLLAPAPPVNSLGRTDRMAIVSGSVSQATAQQIAWSRQNGFECIRFNASCACESRDVLETEVDRVFSLALQSLEHGVVPLIFTAEGPSDSYIEKFNQSLETNNINAALANRNIGKALGQILYKLIMVSGIGRVVISGGDTSGYATRQLDIFALTALAPTIPGAPIFKAHSHGQIDGLEIALKGGQMGSPDYFGWVKDGGGLR